MKKQDAYLIGLMCARGHIYSDSNRIIIEFAHKNKFAEGIAYCPKCGYLATKKGNNDEGKLICKNKDCQSTVENNVKPIYEQVESTKQSIKENIIPFLSEEFNCIFNISGSDTLSFLYMDFTNNKQKFERICSLFQGKYGFDSFDIPSEIYTTDKENKIEFINGILDSAGFFNAGGWLMSDGKNGTGRMRAYIQIVRNWNMPVKICNFLKTEFKLPVQTIDWGHPNIRDSGLSDYIENNATSWSREHQIKFFPEYYNEFSLRVTHKRKMLEELIAHNKKVVFDNKGDCSAPRLITPGDIKPNHPGESNLRIAKEARSHCDTFWQVCMRLGCTQCAIEDKDKFNKLLNFGELLSDEVLEDKRRILEKKRSEKNLEAANKIKSSLEAMPKKVRGAIRVRNNPEQELYEPIVKWYEKYLSLIKEESCFVTDTSSRNLDKYIDECNLRDLFDEWEEWKIKPDIIGIVKSTKSISLIEVKATPLTLENVGQLLGYCLIVNPEEAILVSSKPISNSLLQAVYSSPDILIFDDDLNRKIRLAYWDGTELVFKDVYDD